MTTKYYPSLVNICKEEINKVYNFLSRQRSIFVLTGAGISTESDIPDYRGPNGSQKRGHKPMTHQEFLSKEYNRKRYWARSYLGFQTFFDAVPNNGHQSLVRMKEKISCIVTQNVDCLHTKAGSPNVINLHGAMDKVVCLSCKVKQRREEIQQEMQATNSQWIDQNQIKNNLEQQIKITSDSDAYLQRKVDQNSFVLPSCKICEGVLKPDVVFFGGKVPDTIVDQAFLHLEQSDSILVLGSSLEVFSAYRFVKSALDINKPLLVINSGGTKLDRQNIDHLKINSTIGPILKIVTDIITQDINSD